MGRSRSRSKDRHVDDRRRNRSRSRERKDRIRDKDRDRKPRGQELRARDDRTDTRNRPSVNRRSRSRSPNHSESRNDRRKRSPRRRRDSEDRGGESDAKTGAVPSFLMDRPLVTEQDLLGKSSEEQDLMKMMGFGSFDSTKGKKVPGNDVSAVHVVPKRKYRQYMNRKGGFNRPLDYVS